MIHYISLPVEGHLTNYLSSSMTISTVTSFSNT
nr:MAG TPA: hypothetical protein [Crassvirales sp.]